nr:ferredoxin-type protein NapF [Vibrio pectenicida]
MVGNIVVDLSKRNLLSQRKQESTFLHLPWLSQPSSFTDLCTRCSKCIEACETQIIVKGDGGFPKVDFSVGECTFCHQCADICAEPIFSPTIGKPWAAKAVINSNCLAKQNIDCRTCGDSCEPMAITFQLAIGKVGQPIVNLDECNACGACVSICPASSIDVKNL